MNKPIFEKTNDKGVAPIRRNDVGVPLRNSNRDSSHKSIIAIVDHVSKPIPVKPIKVGLLMENSDTMAPKLKRDELGSLKI